MIRIRIITQQSILIVFLVSSSINPLLALPTKPLSTIKKNRKVVGLFQDVKNFLIQKGLDENVAQKKAEKLLHTQKSTVEMLHYFHKNSQLQIAQDQLIQTLSKYALYEKELNLDSYSSFVGFAQNALARPLNVEELEFIKNIVPS